MATTHRVRSTRDKTKVKRYKNPSTLSPWAKEGGAAGNVWFSMKPKRIIDQYTKGADAPIEIDDPDVEFLFLAPLSIGENIVHTWEAYESVASRLAQKARSLIKLSNEVTAGATAFGQKLKQFEQQLLSDENKNQSVSSDTKGKQGEFVANLVKNAYNSVPGSQIPKIKIDTPMYYSNSDRRQLILEFQLFNETFKDDPRPDKHLIEPIQEMMKYSSPDLDEAGGIGIQFPYMWEVKTEPVQFIKYTTCALIAVQPTWNSPYVKGYPISCNLQLTFQDLSPLYAGTIEYGSIVNVIDGEDRKAQQREMDTLARNAKRYTPPPTPKIRPITNPDRGR
jgi:hypothetical protein